MQTVKKAEQRYLRRALARLTTVAIRKLSVVARKLGAPALTTIPVSAAMLTAIPVVKPGQPLQDVAQLFIGGRNHELAVVEDGLAVGVVTRDDVAAGLESRGPYASVAEAPQHDVVTVTPSDSLADVLDQLRAWPNRVAVVVDAGEPVGLLTFEKLVAYLEHAQRAA
jgi:CBS domain-containing protein